MPNQRILLKTLKESPGNACLILSSSQSFAKYKNDDDAELHNAGSTKANDYIIVGAIASTATELFEIRGFLASKYEQQEQHQQEKLDSFTLFVFPKNTSGFFEETAQEQEMKLQLNKNLLNNNNNSNDVAISDMQPDGVLNCLTPFVQHRGVNIFEATSAGQLIVLAENSRACDYRTERAVPFAEIVLANKKARNARDDVKRPLIVEVQRTQRFGVFLTVGFRNWPPLFAVQVCPPSRSSIAMFQPAKIVVSGGSTKNINNNNNNHNNITSSNVAEASSTSWGKWLEMLPRLAPIMILDTPQLIRRAHGSSMIRTATVNSAPKHNNNNNNSIINHGPTADVNNSNASPARKNNSSYASMMMMMSSPNSHQQQSNKQFGNNNNNNSSCCSVTFLTERTFSSELTIKEVNDIILHQFCSLSATNNNQECYPSKLQKLFFGHSTAIQGPVEHAQEVHKYEFLRKETEELRAKMNHVTQHRRYFYSEDIAQEEEEEEDDKNNDQDLSSTLTPLPFTLPSLPLRSQERRRTEAAPNDAESQPRLREQILIFDSHPSFPHRQNQQGVEEDATTVEELFENMFSSNNKDESSSRPCTPPPPPPSGPPPNDAISVPIVAGSSPSQKNKTKNIFSNGAIRWGTTSITREDERSPLFQENENENNNENRSQSLGASFSRNNGTRTGRSVSSSTTDARMNSISPEPISPNQKRNGQHHHHVDPFVSLLLLQQQQNDDHDNRHNKKTGFENKNNNANNNDNSSLKNKTVIVQISTNQQTGSPNMNLLVDQENEKNRQRKREETNNQLFLSEARNEWQSTMNELRKEAHDISNTEEKKSPESENKKDQKSLHPSKNNITTSETAATTARSKSRSASSLSTQQVVKLTIKRIHIVDAESFANYFISFAGNKHSQQQLPANKAELDNFVTSSNSVFLIRTTSIALPLRGFRTNDILISKCYESCSSSSSSSSATATTTKSGSNNNNNSKNAFPSTSTMTSSMGAHNCVVLSSKGDQIQDGGQFLENGDVCYILSKMQQSAIFPTLFPEKFASMQRQMQKNARNRRSTSNGNIAANNIQVKENTKRSTDELQQQPMPVKKMKNNKTGELNSSKAKKPTTPTKKQQNEQQVLHDASVVAVTETAQNSPNPLHTSSSSPTIKSVTLASLLGKNNRNNNNNNFISESQHELFLSSSDPVKTGLLAGICSPPSSRNNKMFSLLSSSPSTTTLPTERCPRQITVPETSPSRSPSEKRDFNPTLAANNHDIIASSVSRQRTSRSSRSAAEEIPLFVPGVFESTTATATRKSSTSPVSFSSPLSLSATKKGVRSDDAANYSSPMKNINTTSQKRNTNNNNYHHYDTAGASLSAALLDNIALSPPTPSPKKSFTSSSSSFNATVPVFIPSSTNTLLNFSSRRSLFENNNNSRRNEENNNTDSSHYFNTSSQSKPLNLIRPFQTNFVVNDENSKMNNSNTNQALFVGSCGGPSSSASQNGYSFDKSNSYFNNETSSATSLSQPRSSSLQPLSYFSTTNRNINNNDHRSQQQQQQENYFYPKFHSASQSPPERRSKSIASSETAIADGNKMTSSTATNVIFSSSKRYEQNNNHSNIQVGKKEEKPVVVAAQSKTSNHNQQRRYDDSSKIGVKNHHEQIMRAPLSQRSGNEQERQTHTNLRHFYYE